MTTIQWLSIAGGLIILTLSVIALVLQHKVRQQNRRRAAFDQAQQAEAAAKRQEINQSIQIIAKAVSSDERLTLTEASIRISGLLDSLGVPEPVQEEFSAFYQLTRATAHIPYLAEWKQLDKKRQNELEQERLHHEGVYKEFVQAAARRIMGREF